MIEYIILGVLLMMSALFSGLTLGIMSLSTSELKRKADLHDKDAIEVYPIRKNGNLLLTTLLIGNVAVNAAVSIFLSSITSGIVAGLIATSLIVIFGEILPQAVFSRFALSFGARFVWFVKGAMILLYPVAAPIAWALDKALGEELSTVYTKGELLKIVEEHSTSHDSDVDKDEARIIKGALTFSERTVVQIMTPREKISAIEQSRVIDEALLTQLEDVRFSRIPVFDGSFDTVVGILLVKDLINPKLHGQKVEDIMSDSINFVNEHVRLDDTLSMFTKARQHLFIVQNDENRVVGVISLEDVLEEIMRTEIVDEHDDHEDIGHHGH